jgi:hypothetical protein
MKNIHNFPFYCCDDIHEEEILLFLFELQPHIYIEMETICLIPTSTGQVTGMVF